MERIDRTGNDPRICGTFTPPLSAVIKSLFESLGCEVSIFTDSREAAEAIIQDEGCDIIFLQFKMKYSTELIGFIERFFPAIPIVAMTIFQDEIELLTAKYDNGIFILPSITKDSIKEVLQAVNLL